jgi:hypothetical protein
MQRLKMAMMSHTVSFKAQRCFVQSRNILAIVASHLVSYMLLVFGISLEIEINAQGAMMTRNARVRAHRHIDGQLGAAESLLRFASNFLCPLEAKSRRWTNVGLS